jgi:hypothetical protein
MIIKRLVKIVYLIGVFFWCGMLLSSIFKLMGYNEIFEVFSFRKAKTTNYEILENSADENSLSIHYSYNVGDMEFNKKLEVAQTYFNKNFQVSGDSTIEVSYNSIFPHLSYITTLPLEIRKEKTGVVISLIFIGFLSLIYFVGIKRLFSGKTPT